MPRSRRQNDAASASPAATWLQVAALRLERQHLATRVEREALVDVARDVVGIQAQVASYAELQLAARVDGIRRSDVQDAIADRRLVKTWAMRGTLHLLAADDLWRFVAAWPTRDTTRTAPWLKYFKVTLDQLDAVTEAVGEVLDENPRTRAELAAAVGRRVGDAEFSERLMSGWGQFLKPAAGRGLLAFGPDQGRNVTFIKPEDWIGKRPGAKVDPLEGLGRLTERWLAANPGASRDAAVRWWGIASKPTMTRALAASGADVEEVDIEGSTCWVRSADRKALETADPPKGVRLLPGFDPYVNDLPRRVDALLPVKRHGRVYRAAGWITPVVLVDGRVAGTWEVGKGHTAKVEVQPFERWPAATKRGLASEVERIAAFLDRPLKLNFASRAG